MNSDLRASLTSVVPAQLFGAHDASIVDAVRGRGKRDPLDGCHHPLIARAVSEIVMEIRSVENQLHCHETALRFPNGPHFIADFGHRAQFRMEPRECSDGDDRIRGEQGSGRSIRTELRRRTYGSGCRQGNTRIFLLNDGIAFQFQRMHLPDGYAELSHMRRTNSRRSVR